MYSSLSKPGSQARILLVEDDPGIRSGLESILILSNYSCDLYQDGRAALQALTQESCSYDLAVIDLMLPGKSGFEVTQACRTRDIPVIIITARTDIQSELKGFDLGIEDYLIKPFHPLRLLTRIEKILSRMQETANVINMGSLCLNRLSKEVVYHDCRLNLTPLEYDIVHFFVLHPDHTWSKQECLDAIWGEDYIGDPNTFNVHLRQVRQKTGDPDFIETQGRLGFILRSSHFLEEDHKG
ncbi:MAG: response regulator transcription factor [Eubacteriales bacterium]|nr:response regulator transcription factor [Clostridiales bacterium]MDY5836206.1 response regulator transcription factor [Eubacteriales bacterium]